MECKGMGSVHSGFYGALFNGDEEQGRLFDDLVGSIRSADEGKAKAIYLTGSPAFSVVLRHWHVEVPTTGSMQNSALVGKAFGSLAL